MKKHKKNFYKLIKATQFNCCKYCSLKQVLSDDFDAFSYECMKCEDRYKTLSITNPEYDLETLFNIEKQQKLIKYSEEIEP